MKNKIFLIFVLVITLINFTSAGIGFFIKPIESNTIQADKDLKYEFAFTKDSACSLQVFNNLTTIHTNRFGEGFKEISVPVQNDLLDISYICQYRNNLLISSTPLSDAFFNRVYAKNITTRELRVDGKSNFSGTLYINNGTDIQMFNDSIINNSALHIGEENRTKLYCSNITGTQGDICQINDTIDSRINTLDNYWNRTGNTLFPRYSDNVNSSNFTGDWFNGKFNWTTSFKNDYIFGNNTGSTLNIQFNDTKLLTNYINASLVSTIRGTAQGTGGEINYTYDEISYNVTEESGAVGLDIRINFTANSFNQVLIRYKSSDTENHQMKFQIMKCSDSSWEDYATISITRSYEIKNIVSIDSTSHVCDGVVSTRFYQSENGNTAHKHFFDMVVLTNGMSLGGGNEIDPLSWHRNTNITMNGYSIDNASYIQTTYLNVTETLSSKHLSFDNANTSIGTISGNNPNGLNRGNTITSVGYASAHSNKGNDSSFFGDSSGESNLGNDVVLIGSHSGSSNKGSNVTSIGTHSCENNKGNNTICIGQEAGSNNALNDQLIIASSGASSTPLIQGNFSSGFVGIGTNKPSDKLEVAGVIKINDTYPYLRFRSGYWNDESYIQTGVKENGEGSGDYMWIYNPTNRGVVFSVGELGTIFSLSAGSGRVAFPHMQQVSAVGLPVELYVSSGELYAETCTPDTKKNIKDISKEYKDSSIEKIKKLQIKEFDSKDTNDTGMRNILATEETASIENKLVVRYPNGTIAGINERELNSLQLTALQEALKIIENQQEQIDDLRKRIEVLEK